MREDESSGRLTHCEREIMIAVLALANHASAESIRARHSLQHQLVQTEISR